MKRLILLAVLSVLAGRTAADDQASAAAVAALGDLGRLNGQALACGEQAVAAQAKQLAIRHAPKTRRYGELFEQATSTAFLGQGQPEHPPCPPAADFSGRLEELAQRLQTVLPAAPATSG